MNNETLYDKAEEMAERKHFATSNVFVRNSKKRESAVNAMYSRACGITTRTKKSSRLR